MSMCFNTSALGPTKLVYVLQHAFTEAGLSFHGLKKKDQAVAEVLRSATKEADLVHLAIFSRHESGSAEYTAYDNYYRYKCQCWSSDEESDENPAD